MNKKLNFKNLKQSYDKNGFIILRKVLSKNKTIEIKKNILKYFESKSKQLNGRRINYTKKSKKINSIHNFEKVGFVKKMIKNKTFKKIARTFVGERIKSFGAELFAKPAKEGLAVPIHQDNYYWNIDNSKGITIWIALDKSNKKNGGIFYFKKSHLIGIQEHKNSYVPGSSQALKSNFILKKFEKAQTNLSAGDVIIHNCMILHGSNMNKTKMSRTGLTLRYIPKKSKIDKNLKKIYEKKLNSQIRNR